MQVHNQPSFGNYKVIKHSFKYLAEHDQPVVEKAINGYERSLKKASRGLDLTIRVDMKEPAILKLDMLKNKTKLNFGFPIIKKMKKEFTIGLPVEKINEPNVEKLLGKMIGVFKNCVKNSKDDNLGRFVESVLKGFEDTIV